MLLPESLVLDGSRALSALIHLLNEGLAELPNRLFSAHGATRLERILAVADQSQLPKRRDTRLFDGHGSKYAKRQATELIASTRTVTDDESLPSMDLPVGGGSLGDSYSEAFELGVPREVVAVGRKLEGINDSFSEVGSGHF